MDFLTGKKKEKKQSVREQFVGATEVKKLQIFNIEITKSVLIKMCSKLESF